MNLPEGRGPLRRILVRSDVVVGAALLAWVVLAVVKQYEPDTYLQRDGAFYATMVRSLTTELTLDQSHYQPRSWYSGTLPYYRELDLAWSNIALGRDGRYWPKHSYLMPIAAVPFYLVMGKLGLLVFNVVQCVMFLLLSYKIAEYFTGTVPAATAVLLLATSPIVIESAYRFSHDIFSGLLVAASILALIRRRMLLAGALTGLALWAKATNVLVVGPVGLALAVSFGRPKLRDEWLPFVGAAAVPLTLWAAANWYMFGSPTSTSYDRILVVIGGVPQTQGLRIAFDQPLGPGVRALLGEGDGMAAMMPLAFVGALGLLLLLRRAPLMAIASLVALAAYPLVFGPYRWPHTRFFFPWLPVVALGLAALLALVGAWRPWRFVASLLARGPRWTGAAAIGGVAVLCLLAIAIHRDPPRASARIARAEVFLGDVPCDYFNPQHDKWECSRIDSAPFELTGAAETGQCVFDEDTGPLVWAHPHRSGQPRRLRWHVPRSSHGRFLVGIDAASDPAPANVELWVNGTLVRAVTPAVPGHLSHYPLPLPNDDNEVEVRALPPWNGRNVCFDLRW